MGDFILTREHPAPPEPPLIFQRSRVNYKCLVPWQWPNIQRQSLIILQTMPL